MAFLRICLAVALAWELLFAAANAAPPSAQQLQSWVKQLDAEDYAAREEATRQLTAAAEAGIDVLADGVASRSPEVAWRASESLQQIAIQGNEATLSRVVAALDKLSAGGKPGLTNIAQQLRAKQAKLRHDRAAAQVRALGGKLQGGGRDAASFMAVEVFGGAMPVPVAFDELDVRVELVREIRGIEALEAAEALLAEAEPKPAKGGGLKALDAALKRLSDLLPVVIEPEPPAAFFEPAPPVADVPTPAPARILEPLPAPELPQAPALDAAPVAEPEAPAAEAPLAEPGAEGELAPVEVGVAIADAIAIDGADFIVGPMFGGGFFVEESLMPDTGEALSTSLVLDSAWRGGDEGLQTLRDLPSLYSLSIVDARLTDAALEHIATLPNLQDLSIVNTKLSVESLARFRKQRPTTRIFARGAAMLGVHADLSGSCVLTGIYDGSGAAEAGLRAGDQVVMIDGHKISDFSDLTIAVYAHAPGEKLKVEYLRGGEKNATDVELRPRTDLEAPRR